jgi:predicted ATPase/DNA-binding winged helix-turn-helix (wHTH) protein
MKPPAAAHRFDGWELRADEHLLLVQGVPAKIGRPAFRLLLALIEGQGRVVAKEVLIAAGWPGRVVEDNNLTVQITALRRALGQARVIVNVSGMGYRLAATPLPASEAPAPAPAPAATPAGLIGREADLAQLAALVHRSPLVSVVGTGGVGKTTLARAVLEALGSGWRDGVHWIDLAPQPRDAPLPQIVARALSVLPDAAGGISEDLISLLSQLQALVVLDNCEHLLGEVAALVAALLPHAGGIRWLVTSQEPLRLADEMVFRLLPLQVPAAGAELGEALASGAMALLLARVRGANPAFELRPSELATAVALCRHLDGLPLALEMAAARVATLGLRAVGEQIDQRLRLRAATRGAPARHHTLLQTFEWSYGLLSPVEQRVFRRLAPFVGGFTAQMAQQLCCGTEDGAALDGWEMLDALSALVEKSLVQRLGAGSPAAPDRLHLLESARDFARLQLQAAGEAERVQRRHAEIVADAFELAQYELERWRDADWAAKYAPERPNLGVALGWACAARDPALLARLVAALARLDTFAHSEAEVVRHPVPLEVLQQAPLPLRAQACLEFGWAHYLHGHRETGSGLLQGALDDFEALGDVAGVYATLTCLIRMLRGRPGQQAVVAAMWQRLQQIDERVVPLRSRLHCSTSVAFHFDGAGNIEHLRRLQRIAQSAGFDHQAAACQLYITNELLQAGRLEEAVAVAHHMLRADRAGLSLRALTAHNLALALVRLGRFEDAHRAAQVLMRALPGAADLVMDLFAWVALQVGRREDAALMAGRSAQLKRERDWLSEPTEAALIHETVQRLEAELGDAVVAQLQALGAAMATADVLALARPA